jgi:hypothetical protein
VKVSNEFLCELAASVMSGDENVADAVDKAEAIVAEVESRHPDTAPDHSKKAGAK